MQVLHLGTTTADDTDAIEELFNWPGLSQVRRLTGLTAGGDSLADSVLYFIAESPYLRRLEHLQLHFSDAYTDAGIEMLLSSTNLPRKRCSCTATITTSASPSWPASRRVSVRCTPTIGAERCAQEDRLRTARATPRSAGVPRRDQADDPDDEDPPRLVLADWLDERGDEHDAARGRYLLSCERRKLADDDPGRATIDDELGKLRKRHESAWLGLLAG